MAGKIIEAGEVNIDEYPELDAVNNPTNTPNIELTMGDLHGNALKLLFFLIKHGVLELAPKEEGKTPQTLYQELVQIYNTPVDDLDEGQLARFNAVINNAKCNKAKVRLIGDELADRGMNDYFTLKILQKLGQEKVPVEILLSNHSIEFLKAYKQGFMHFESSIDADGQINSYRNFETLLNKGLIVEEEINPIVKDYYLPSLKLISYSIDKNVKPPTITLYTHAPVGLETLEALAKDLLSKSYKVAQTIDELKDTIDAINAEFSKLVKGELQQEISESDGLSATVRNKAIELSDKLTASGQGVDPRYASVEHPYDRLIWHRGDDGAERSISQGSNDTLFHIHYVYGHDGGTGTNGNVHGINNILGMGNNTHKGEYGIFVAQSTNAPKLELTANKAEQAKAGLIAAFKEKGQEVKDITILSAPGGTEGKNYLYFIITLVDNNAQANFVNATKAQTHAKNGLYLNQKRLKDFLATCNNSEALKEHVQTLLDDYNLRNPNALNSPQSSSSSKVTSPTAPLGSSTPTTTSQEQDKNNSQKTITTPDDSITPKQSSPNSLNVSFPQTSPNKANPKPVDFMAFCTKAVFDSCPNLKNIPIIDNTDHKRIRLKSATADDPSDIKVYKTEVVCDKPAVNSIFAMAEFLAIAKKDQDKTVKIEGGTAESREALAKACEAKGLKPQIKDSAGNFKLFDSKKSNVPPPPNSSTNLPNPAPGNLDQLSEHKIEVKRNQKVN